MIDDPYFDLGEYISQHTDDPAWKPTGILCRAFHPILDQLPSLKELYSSDSQWQFLLSPKTYHQLLPLIAKGKRYERARKRMARKRRAMQRKHNRGERCY